MTSDATRARIEGARPAKPKPLPVILLIETPDGPVGVRFSDRVAARAWEDEHEDELTAVGCVNVVTRTEALRLANPQE